MRAVVLGGGGLTGRCAVRDLVRGGRFTEVVAADLDRGLAEAAARAAGPTARAETCDVRSAPSLRNALTGATVCVNAVQYTFNLEVMRGCLDAGVPYLDFGGLFHTTRRQMRLDEEFRQAQLLAIPGMGQVPGASNILARAATEDLDSVESLVIRDGWRDLTENGPEVVFTWSPSTFLDEMVLPAQVWDSGRYHEVPAMSGGEEFDFPEPIGRTRVYRTLHSEPATLPATLSKGNVAHCEWKEGGPGIEMLRSLALLGLGGSEPIEVNGHPVPPKEFLLALLRQRGLLGYPAGVTIDDWEVVDLEVKGRKGGQTIVRHAQARFPPKPEWHLSATEYAVGVCGAIGAEMIAGGLASGFGVVPPELAILPEPFRAALRERGIESALSPPEAPLGPEFRLGAKR
jgi:saccharopine dehydrogenase-like NADP-dependent oxidoreductase